MAAVAVADAVAVGFHVLEEAAILEPFELNCKGFKKYIRVSFNLDTEISQDYPTLRL